MSVDTELPKALDGEALQAEIAAALDEMEVGMHIVNTARIRLKKAAGKYPQAQNFETYSEQCARRSEGDKPNPWLNVPEGHIESLLERSKGQSG